MKPTRYLQGRKANAEILRVKAFADDRNVVGLIRMLDSDLRGLTKYSVVRSHAAQWLGRLGDSRAIPYLVDRRHDPEEIVRFMVMRALGQLRAREAKDALLEGLSDPGRVVRMGAASALARIDAVDAVPALRKTVGSDPDMYVRASAVEALLVLGDETARERVPEVLSALGWRARGPRWKRLGEAAESGALLTPWVDAGDRRYEV